MEQKHKKQWNVIIGEILKEVAYTFSENFEDVANHISEFHNKTIKNEDTEDTWVANEQTIKNWFYGIHSPGKSGKKSDNYRRGLFDYIKSSVETKGNNHSKYRKIVDDVLKKHNCDNFFANCFDDSIANTIIKIFIKCISNKSKDFTKFGVNVDEADIEPKHKMPPLELRQGHYSKDDDVIKRISKAENDIFISGVGLQHIYLRGEKLFASVKNSVSLTFATQDYRNTSLSNFFLRTKDDWVYRRKSFDRGIKELKKRFKKVTEVKLKTFLPVAHVAVDYMDKAEHSFIYVSYYLMSDGISEDEHLKRHSFIVEPRHGDIYDDYCTQIQELIKYGGDMKRRFCERGLPIPTAELLEEFSEDLSLQALELVFGKNRRYAFDAIRHKTELSSLLLEKNETLYHYILHPLGERSSNGYNSIQRGKIKLSLKNGICYLDMECVNSRGVDSKYNGFAVMLDPMQSSGNCWFFMKSSEKQSAELAVFCFRLRGDDDNNWNTRVAELLTIKGKNSRPVVCRVILSKEYIQDTEVKYYIGHLKLGRSTITISKVLFDSAIEFFRCEELLTESVAANCNDLKEHFSGVDKSDILEIFNGISTQNAGTNYKISLNRKAAGGAANIKAFTYDIDNSPNGPLVLSWLRKHDNVVPNNNQSLGKLDDDVEDLFNWVQNNLKSKCTPKSQK